MALTKEQMKLLLDDLCARLSYSVKGTVKTTDGNGQEITDDGIINSAFIDEHGKAYICVESAEYELEDVKPYLRPMSSMTEEEIYEYNKLVELDRSNKELFNNLRIEYIQNHPEYKNMPCVPMYRHIDYLNTHHFDYRGLIPMGLALPATEGMY